ncbi:unnamed protein product [Mytilus edulis]|uniref:Uncharacterized protein n=1 Tax=Mytilus edulis TaxID=6550 RepID=A0A8S3RQB5_MYTED|nr:unnamed protein product [Mytilus edulis]
MDFYGDKVLSEIGGVIMFVSILGTSIATAIKADDIEGTSNGYLFPFDFGKGTGDDSMGVKTQDDADKEPLLKAEVVNINDPDGDSYFDDSSFDNQYDDNPDQPRIAGQDKKYLPTRSQTEGLYVNLQPTQPPIEGDYIEFLPVPEGEDMEFNPAQPHGEGEYEEYQPHNLPNTNEEPLYDSADGMLNRQSLPNADEEPLYDSADGMLNRQPYEPQPNYGSRTINSFGVPPHPPPPPPPGNKPYEPQPNYGSRTMNSYGVPPHPPPPTAATTTTTTTTW